MTRLAKILVVFVAAASLSFAAFAAAMRSGGANWEALAASSAISERVAIVRGDTGTYTATARVKGDQIASSMNLADVVLKSQARVLSDMRSELQDLQTRITTLGPQQQVVASVVEVDRAGLDRHLQVWDTQLKTLDEQLTQLTDRLSMTGAQAQQLQAELREMRFEVLRLRNQLELLRDDSFAANEQKLALESELLLLKESRMRLERRQQLLQSQAAGVTSE